MERLVEIEQYSVYVTPRKVRLKSDAAVRFMLGAGGEIELDGFALENSNRYDSTEARNYLVR
jgi:hypothetical protein